jgi:sec-independent protein translocase protein TatB
MFDISLPKLLVLAVIALVVFGPKNLPKIAARAGSALRRIADAAKADLRKVSARSSPTSTSMTSTHAEAT